MVLKKSAALYLPLTVLIAISVVLYVNRARVPGSRAGPVGQPDRPPELYGVVEEILPGSLKTIVIRLSCRKPSRPELEAPQNLQEAERLSTYLVHCDQSHRVRGQPDTTQVGVGQWVSVWWQGPVMKTDPPQVVAQFLVIEETTVE